MQPRIAGSVGNPDNRELLDSVLPGYGFERQPPMPAPLEPWLGQTRKTHVTVSADFERQSVLGPCLITVVLSRHLLQALGLHPIVRPLALSLRHGQLNPTQLLESAVVDDKYIAVIGQRQQHQFLQILDRVRPSAVTVTARYRAYDQIVAVRTQAMSRAFSSIFQQIET